MNSPVFIDTNVPTYVSGGEHPLREPSTEILKTVARNPSAFFTDAEVLQELLHRYTSLRRWISPGKQTFAEFASLMAGRIVPMLAEDVARAAELVDTYPRLSARDLVHLAVMERVGATAIVTADTTFDGLKGIERLDPARAAAWLPHFASVD